MNKLKNVMTYFAASAALLSLAIPLMAPAAVSAQVVLSKPMPSSGSSSSSCYTFNSNLGEGRPLSTQDASALTTALTDAGVWTAGTPITAYTDQVASAVSGFQQQYASQILTPNGLSYGTGYVGASTRAELNSLYGCSTSTPITTSTQPTGPTKPFSCPASYTCTPITQNPAPTCPAGYTCVPVTTPPNPTSPVATTPVNSSPASSFVWTSSDPANPNSVQGQLQAQGETWTEVPGTITTGSYVEDTLESRLNQPEGRGAIGQVTYTGTSGGSQYATVNFGNGWTVNIDFNELSLVTVSGGTSNPVSPTNPTNPVSPTAANCPTNWTCTYAPVISALNGNGTAGYMTAGAVNNVAGKYFTGITSAYINGTNNLSQGLYGDKTSYYLGYTVNNDASVNLTVPASVPSGQYSLLFVNSAGTSQPFSVTISSSVTVPSTSTTTPPVTSSAQPSISSITPASANPGSSIHLSGSGFGTGTNDSVSLSSVSSTGQETYVSTVWQGQPTDASDITFTLPQSMAAGNYDLYVIVPFSGTSCNNCSLVQTSVSAHMYFTVL